MAQRIGVEPAYLSKIERDQVAPPSEAAIRRLAAELEADPDLLLAMAGKVSSDLQAIVLRRPQLFAICSGSSGTSPTTPSCGSRARSGTATGRHPPVREATE